MLNALSINFRNDNEIIPLSNLSNTNLNDEVEFRILNWMSDAISEFEILGNPKTAPCGYFSDLDEIVFQYDSYRIKSFLSNVKISYCNNSAIKEINALQYYDRLWDYLYGHDCNCEGRALQLISLSVAEFIHQGAWQISLNDYDISRSHNDAGIKPKLDDIVIWFGLFNDVPIDCWSIYPYEFNDNICVHDTLSSWYDDDYWLDIISCNDVSSDTILYVASEFGISLPNRTILLDSLPIKIYDNMSGRNFKNEVNRLLRH